MQKDELTPTQKVAREAKKTRIVLLLEVIIALVGVKDNREEDLASLPVENLRVIEEIL